MIADHLDADFCVSTSTGYGANLLAFSALLSQDWLLVLDEKSHNSMFVAAYLSEPGCIKKFRHNDMGHLEQILRECGPKFTRTLIAVEGFYRSDGS
jgi:7-keto-8-aminopelargonate synthetase-like enzyme